MENFFKIKNTKQQIVNQQSQPKKKVKEKYDSSKTKLLTVLKFSEYKTTSILSLLEKQKFNSNYDLYIKKEQFLPFFILSDLFELISQTSGKDSVSKKKNYIQQIFEFVIQNNPSELIDVYHFCILRTDVEWIQKDTGVGPEILQNSLKTVTGLNIKQIRDKFKKIGDLGNILESQKQGQQFLTSFYKKNEKKENERTIKQISNISGENSKVGKENCIVGLLRSLTAQEGKYFIRFLNKNLKIGGAEKIFQKSLSQAFCNVYEDNKIEVFPKKVKYEIEDLDPKILIKGLHNVSLNIYQNLHLDDQYKLWEDIFIKILSQFPNTKVLIENLINFKKIPQIIDICKLTLYTPCKPMLAKPTKSLSQIFDRLQDNPFTCEYKYDGLRGQIHFDLLSKKIQIFSRNLENITNQYPDIAQVLLDTKQEEIQLENKLKEMKNFIIDTEIVAYDKKNDRILPFQTLSKRQRINVEITDDSIQVCIFIFDILQLNDQPLINKTFRERRQHLYELLQLCYQNNQMIKKAESKDCNDVEEIQEYLLESIKNQCEGLMVKTLDYNSSYEPAKRSFKWLKVKKDYIDNGGIGDSLDLVVIGANYGKGKRVGKFGVYLMACYDVDYDTFESCCFVGTGFSDQQLSDFYDNLKDYQIQEKPENYLISNKSVDVWLEPKVVWEIKCADIQISPLYKCGYNQLALDSGKGMGLRFPRFIRVRDDKLIQNATQPQFIYEIYKNQAACADEEEDYY